MPSDPVLYTGTCSIHNDTSVVLGSVLSACDASSWRDMIPGLERAIARYKQLLCQTCAEEESRAGPSKQSAAMSLQTSASVSLSHTHERQATEHNNDCIPPCYLRYPIRVAIDGLGP